MCGIIGGLSFGDSSDKEFENKRNEAVILLTTQITQETVDRGKDATGVSLVWQDGYYWGLKMGIDSPKFITRFGGGKEDFEGFLKIWREYQSPMKAFIGHCRKATVGNSYDNKNNHPLKFGNLITVHNGTLTNHEQIFDHLSCDKESDVDSEAICRLLRFYTNDENDPFTKEAILEVTKRIHGTYSVLAMSANNPFQAVQFRDGRPAEMVLVKPLSTVLIASEKKYLNNALFEYNKYVKLFGNKAGLPYIKADSVDYKTLADDSFVIWDLSKEVSDSTKIDDLCESGKTVYRGQKIWDKFATPVNKESDANAQTQTAHSNKSKEVNVRTVAASDFDDDGDDDLFGQGMLWSKTDNSYKTQKHIDTTMGIGNVQIQTSTGIISETACESKILLTDITDEDIGLEEVSERKVEDLICSPADIMAGVDVEHTDGVKSKPTDTNRQNLSEALDAANKNACAADSNRVHYTEALKAGEKYIDQGLKKYESEGEVLEGLGVSNSAILANLPIHALANRINKLVSKDAFMEGFMVARSLSKPGSKHEPILSSKKAISARRKMRTLKTVMYTVASLLADYHAPNGQHSVARLRGVIRKIMAPGKVHTLTEENINSVFTAGDLRRMPVIKDIIEVSSQES